MAADGRKPQRGLGWRVARNVGAFGIGVFLVWFMVRASEKVFYELNKANLERTSFEGGYWDLFSYDEVLGSRPASNVEKRVAKSVDGQLIYGVVYRTDAYGRRITPQDVGADKADRFIAFFGCSYTFGEGLAEDETLPYHVASLAPDWRVYNYGCPGYGPQQMLARLETEDLAEQIEEPSGILVYVFASFHVRRAIGSMRVASSWGRAFPYYCLDGEGGLVRKGTFTSGRPRLATWYGRLGKSDTLWYWDFDVPLFLKDGHLALTSRIIAASRDRFQKTFPNSRFCVLLYPGKPNAELSGKRIIPFLEQAGLEFLDFTALIDMRQPAFTIKEDGHPTGAANRRVAERLAAELRLGAIEGGE